MSPRTVTADDRVRAVLYPLDGVGLDELVDAAALLTRVDRKYVLPVDDAVTVLDALARTAPARVLEIDGARSAAYESVYFDTPDLASFRLTATRRRRRFKVRTRTYLDSGASFLEVKTRAARGTTLKQRVAHDGCPTALGADRTFVGRTLAAEGIEGVPEHALAPGLVSRYRRTTLLLPRADGAARATVDTGLTWELDQPGAHAPLAWLVPHLVVVETKGGSTPSDLDRLLWRHGHRPERISKYGTGLALLRPDLPDGPWRRVIRRHLSPSPDATAPAGTTTPPARTPGHDDRSL
ncbi:polyphosphate polymerase domain-containing protein [Cellulosimicrobium cellulans]|uniref:polyphosphate polymerase domain-containing protein n=1 Tax=Cellulosimicrobium cellulans TaxID=1710 RepID=UPI002098285F|nr:polyphosphate polymerase domain-containing protein [Cellulosimicrobium cellulans]MCO7274681.1 polyphosphate polymerase domain-containing protein [Cellulosimicrobium cellulans]